LYDEVLLKVDDLQREISTKTASVEFLEKRRDEDERERARFEEQIQKLLEQLEGSVPR
jgi:peptidoglycan hydrolase CwlO-like protein